MTTEADKKDEVKQEENKATEVSERETNNEPEKEGKQEEAVTDNPEKDTPKENKSTNKEFEELERTRKALEKVNEESKNRRLKLREWEELGVDSETVKKWKEDREKAELEAMEEERRYQEIIERTRSEANTDVQKAQEQREAMKQQLESYLVDKNITEAIAAEEGVPRLLQSVAKQYVKTVQNEAGEYSTVVVDEEGIPRKSEREEPMTIRDLVSSFKEDPDLRYAFKAPKVSGADVSGSDNSATTRSAPRKHRSKMNPKEQRDYVAKYGYEEFRKLPR